MSESKYMIERTVRRDRTVIVGGRSWAVPFAAPGQKVTVTLTPNGPVFRIQVPRDVLPVFCGGVDR